MNRNTYAGPEPTKAVAALQATDCGDAAARHQKGVFAKILLEAAEARVGAHLEDGRERMVAAGRAQLQSVHTRNLLDEREIP